MSIKQFAANLDDRYVDVDFEKEPEYTRGVIDVSTFAMGELPSFEAEIGVLPWTDIDAAIDAIAEAGLSNADYVTRIYNQGQEGSCTYNMGAQGLETLQAKQFGRDAVVPLSAISGYKQIGRSANSGATIPETFTALINFGAVPLDTPENRERFGSAVMPHTGFNTPYPAGAKDTAKLFRLSEAYIIRSSQAYFTALASGWMVGVGRDGHAVLNLTPIRDGGNRKSVYVNSWGRWGMAFGQHEYGFGVDTARQINQSVSYAIAMRALKAPWAT